MSIGSNDTAFSVVTLTTGTLGEQELWNLYRCNTRASQCEGMEIAGIDNNSKEKFIPLVKKGKEEIGWLQVKVDWVL